MVVVVFLHELVLLIRSLSTQRMGLIYHGHGSLLHRFLLIVLGTSGNLRLTCSRTRAMIKSQNLEGRFSSFLPCSSRFLHINSVYSLVSPDGYKGIRQFDGYPQADCSYSLRYFLISPVPSLDFSYALRSFLISPTPSPSNGLGFSDVGHFQQKNEGGKT